MAFWKSSFLTKRRTEWLNSIVRAQYYAGSTWYNAVITSKAIVGNALVINVTTTDSAALTITAVRLFDRDGEIAGEQAENLTKKSTQGVLLQFSFPLYETES